jgi:hypothetical protein
MACNHIIADFMKLPSQCRSGIVCPRCLCTMKVVSHLTADCQNCRSQSQGNYRYRFCVCCLHAQGHCIPCKIWAEDNTSKAELRIQERDKKYISPLPIRETRPARDPGYRPTHRDPKPYEPSASDQLSEILEESFQRLQRCGSWSDRIWTIWRHDTGRWNFYKTGNYDHDSAGLGGMEQKPRSIVQLDKPGPKHLRRHTENMDHG